MSRASSRKGSAKKKPKTPKQQIKELTEQNAELQAELDLLRANEVLLTEKLVTVTNKVLSGVKRRDYYIRDDADPLQIQTQVVLDMISSLIVKKRAYDVSVEARADELEQRVTRMSMELARATRKTAAYECGLNELLACSDVEQVRDRVYQLQLIAGQAYHDFEAQEAYLGSTHLSSTTSAPMSVCPPSPSPDPTHLVILPDATCTVIRRPTPVPDVTTKDFPPADVTHAAQHTSQGVPPTLLPPLSPSSAGRHPSRLPVIVTGDTADNTQLSPAQLLARDSAREFNLTPPLKKLPADTHIKNMHKDLKLYVMKELSVEKQSGADWRMLASRVNIEADVISYWSTLGLTCPMGRVLTEWSQDNSATVHLLHRHLMSPQMRCTIVAKRIADFYSVL